MKKVETSHIPKLNGDNYQPWKLQVTLALQAGGVWGYIDGTKKKPTLKTDGSNQTDVDKWDENDVGARSLIVQLLEQGQMAHIYACDSAKTTWEKIAEVNSDASILNVQRTLTRFYNFKISEDRSAVEACGELEELARALKEMGNPVTAQALVIKAVSSLPESKFHAFKRAWGSVDAASQTMANLIARIKNEELSFKANGEGGEEQQQFNIAFNAQNGNKKFQKGKSNQQQQQQQPQKKKREGACRNCGIEGHWARECRKPKREEGDEAKCNNNNNNNNSNRKQNRKNNKKQNEGPGDCQAFLGGHEMEEGSTRWISDSGASFHITGRKDWLTDYKEFKNPIPVSITDNSSIRALGKGTVQVEAWVQGEWYPISIHNAHYIPGAVNLFSEGIMDQKGFKIVKENGKTTYYFKGQQGPQAWWLNGNYVMGFRVPKNSAYSATINKTKLWHERLAHVNMGYIKNAVKVGAVEGIKMEDLASDFHCSDCHLGKETRQPFPEREKNKNLQPGDVIHADLSGKDSTTSLQGSNYFLLLKDEKTGFRQVCFLKKKSDAAANIINFLKMFKNQTSKNIKIFKSDNGGEFMCRELQDYFRDQGILHQTSAPRCPETNGLIERDMRTVKEASKTMIIKAGQSPGMWEEAVGFAVYILNRLPNRNSPNCTPFEQVFGWPPDLSHVRTFGCTAYAQIPEEDRDPSDPKARIGKLVGYGTFGRKFKVYIPEKRKVVPARNVSFLEDGGVRTSYEVEEDDAKHENEQQQQQEEQQEKIHDASSQSTSSHTTKPDEEEVFMDADDEGETTILVETPEGNYEYDPDKKKIEIPSRKLRSKDMIKPPKKYQSFVASSPTIPRNYEDAISQPEGEKWMEAMKTEMRSLEGNRTWKYVPRPRHAKVLEPKWVFSIKKNMNGEIERFKARLVVRGYRQQFGVDYQETFSTVARFESIRFILAFTAADGWKYKQFDVKTAYLNGVLDEEIFMSQPEGFEIDGDDLVCLLLKSLYGLKQSSRCWNRTFSDFLKSIGLFPTHSDPCVFIGVIFGFIVIVVLYVDDGIVTSKSELAIAFVVDAMKKAFEITRKDLEVFVGIEITIEGGTMTLAQHQYTEALLEKYDITERRTASVPMKQNLDLVKAENCDTAYPYQELIGSLLFLARVTRPDIAYAVTKLSQFNTCYDKTHWDAAQDVLLYLRRTGTLGIQYECNSEFVISAYTDSDFAGDKNDRKSTTGFATFVNDSLITWCSQKQDVVTLSSTEAEYTALCAGAKEVAWLRKFAEEIGREQEEPTTIMVDNTSAIRLVDNPEFHKRTKHVDVKYHYTRQLAEEKKVEVVYTPTQDQKADILTKPLGKSKHADMVEKIGLKPVNRKPRGGGGSLFWTWAMMMCLLGVTQGVNIQNSQPILWRGSPVPVISGYETVYLRIKLISPCTLLTEEIVPKGQLETAKKICNEMYETYFIHEMKQMCPSFHNFSMSKHRPKRFILVALIALGAVVVTGLGIGGVVLAANNAARISDLEEISSLQEKSINQLEEQMNFTEIALQKLRTDFNILVKDHEVLDKNLNEITEKGPNTYFTISYITTKLMMGKQVIKEATRAWNNKKILNGMMDYFNITLPCGEDECPLSLATGKRCYFGEDMKDLYIQMDMPKVNKALQLVEADAFDLMLQTWNQTCRITYNGPENAILSKKEGCPVALNLKTSRMYDLVLSSSQDCLKGFKNKSENSYFSVKHCQGRGEKDAEDFIQVKPHHGSLHVYCFGCNITIDNLSQECPKEVFILPIGARFRINNQEFTGSIVHIEHQDSPDPLFTMRTNAYLKPRVDYQELMKDPMVNNHFVFSKGETWTHSETWHMEIGLIITLLVVIIVLACILTKCYLDHRKIKVKVVTKPKPLRNQEIEEDEDSQ
ncbi:Copia protein [Folsomia candida]|uniref:Copia protein n=1 Tax=Folsomia candida TaxID=158441 RepID=A0A226D3P5_FOLCA|nr:Copia protein [Folsomia candida]